MPSVQPKTRLDWSAEMSAERPWWVSKSRLQITCGCLSVDQTCIVKLFNHPVRCRLYTGWPPQKRDSQSGSIFFLLHNGISSNLLPIECGVPQGSNLGPLLFLLYINDISQSASPLLSYILFAEDTNIFYSHTNLNTLVNTLNTELPKIST